MRLSSDRNTDNFSIHHRGSPSWLPFFNVSSTYNHHRETVVGSLSQKPFGQLFLHSVSGLSWPVNLDLHCQSGFSDLKSADLHCRSGFPELKSLDLHCQSGFSDLKSPDLHCRSGFPDLKSPDLHCRSDFSDLKNADLHCRSGISDLKSADLHCRSGFPDLKSADLHCRSDFPDLKSPDLHCQWDGDSEFISAPKDRPYVCSSSSRRSSQSSPARQGIYEKSLALDGMSGEALLFRFVAERFLLLSGQSTLHLLHVFGRGQIFRDNTTLDHHLAHSCIVVHMFTTDLRFPVECFLLHVHMGHFGRKVFRLDTDGR